MSADAKKIKQHAARKIGIQVAAQRWPNGSTLDDIQTYKVLYAVELCKEIGFSIPMTTQFAAKFDDMRSSASIMDWVRKHAVPSEVPTIIASPITAREMLEEIEGLKSFNAELLSRETKMLRIIHAAVNWARHITEPISLEGTLLKKELLDQGYIAA